MSQSQNTPARDEVLEQTSEQEDMRNEQDQAIPENQDAGQPETAEPVAEFEPIGEDAGSFKQQAEEHYQKLLRVQADYDNFRRRSRLEKEEFAKYASQKLIEELLPVYDNFDRALLAGKDATDADAFLKGVEMIFRQFAGVLEAEGVKPIEAVGQPFNPEFHQAIMQVESDEYGEGIVVEEVQKGYMMKDKVIRPSMVKVSS